MSNHKCYSYTFNYASVSHTSKSGRKYDLFKYFICDRCNQAVVKTLASNVSATKIFKDTGIKV